MCYLGQPLFLITGFLPCAIMLCLYFLNDNTLSAAQLQTVFVCLGALFSLWFLVGALAIGCIAVLIMKGPAYVADAYALPAENEALEPIKQYNYY